MYDGTPFVLRYTHNTKYIEVRFYFTLPIIAVMTIPYYCKTLS